MSDPQPFSRREFLQTGSALIGFSRAAPAFLAGTVQFICTEANAALTASRPGIPDDRILVVIQFAGGNDGLNTVVPYRNDDYYRARPKLAVPADQVLKIDADLGWHPQATAFARLYDAGDLSIIHGVGYPNPDRSHFVGTRIWHTASPKGRFADGWIGRYFDQTATSNQARKKPKRSPDPRSGIALVGETPLVMRGEAFRPICVSHPETFGGLGRRAVNPNLVPTPTRTPVPKSAGNLDFLRQATLDAAVHARQIRSAAQTAIDGADFPQTQFARSLRGVARMIAAGMPTKVYFVQLTGFDTHNNQTNRHGRLLKNAADALAAFVDALRRTDNLSRTLVMTFSEFGRRVEENASGGTDHGQAAPMFLLGGTAKPGQHANVPSLTNLADGDLQFQVDFRRVYATVLANWLGANDRRILGQPFNHLPLFET